MSHLRTAPRSARGVEVAIGRGLACCAHPAIAWRQLPPARRALLVAAYAAAGYLSVLSALLVG